MAWLPFTFKDCTAKKNSQYNANWKPAATTSDQSKPLLIHTSAIGHRHIDSYMCVRSEQPFDSYILFATQCQCMHSVHLYNTPARIQTAKQQRRRRRRQQLRWHRYVCAHTNKKTHYLLSFKYTHHHEYVYIMYDIYKHTNVYVIMYVLLLLYMCEHIAC